MDLVPNNIPNIRCLAKACDKLAISYSYYDRNHNFIGIMLPELYLFANASTPFNSHSVAKICKDKQFTYQLIKEVINMPKTVGFLNPDCDEKFRKYLTHVSVDEIIGAIQDTFSFPVIVKKNAGSQGANVFCCRTHQDIQRAVTTIYDKNSYLFDYIALAQQYIDIKHEFRIVTYKGKIILAYEKDISHASFAGNLSPLHFENSKAIVITDTELLHRIQSFIQPLFSKIPLNFSGLDIAFDAKNKLWLLELNSSPGFEHFVEDNGDELLVDMYQKILVECLASF